MTLPVTGSKDPFALRRTAIGAIRVLLENDARLPLNDLMAAWINVFAEQQRAKEAAE